MWILRRNISIYWRAIASAVFVFSSSLAEADDWRSPVAPVDSKPYGQTYGRWATQWWQWALGVPAAKNPLSDTTGQFCGQQQIDDVWFLAGTFGSEKIVRTCAIPPNKALFFPLINTAYLAFLNDPPDQRTDQYVRSQAKCTQPVQISASIDGAKVEHPELYFTGRSGAESPFFNLQMPPGNYYGLTESNAPQLLLSPSAEQGYYLFVNPLSPGKHTLKWRATGCTQGSIQDITYNLTVTK